MVASSSAAPWSVKFIPANVTFTKSDKSRFQKVEILAFQAGDLLVSFVPIGKSANEYEP